ncbi:hypothetical protein QL285_061167 [Trifolium repens]|nr:hypothetical protein QL285_061167 [Trifolium repens]
MLLRIGTRRNASLKRFPTSQRIPNHNQLLLQATGCDRFITPLRNKATLKVLLTTFNAFVVHILCDLYRNRVIFHRGLTKPANINVTYVRERSSEYFSWLFWRPTMARKC